MRELLCNNSLFVGQLYEDKSLSLCARDLIFFTTDLITYQFTDRADLFLNYKLYLLDLRIVYFAFLAFDFHSDV